MKKILLLFLCIFFASTHTMIISGDSNMFSSFFKTLRDDIKSVIKRDCSREQKQRLVKQGAFALAAIGAAVGGAGLAWYVLCSKKPEQDDDSGGEEIYHNLPGDPQKEGAEKKWMEEFCECSSESDKIGMLNNAPEGYLDSVNFSKLLHRESIEGNLIYREFGELNEEKRKYFARKIIEVGGFTDELIKLATIKEMPECHPFAQIINETTEDELEKVFWNMRTLRNKDNAPVGPTLKDKIIQCNFSESSVGYWHDTAQDYDNKNFQYLTEDKQQYFRELWPESFETD